jgi:hypothetical protein
MGSFLEVQRRVVAEGHEALRLEVVAAKIAAAAEEEK